jgi:chloramphenicol-sensitive protein RarD
LVPLYFKQVASISPFAVLAHRVVWSGVFLSILVTMQNLWPEVKRCFRSRTILLWLAGSTIAVAINWFTFIYAISNNHILEASLGYFINPLFSVLVGVTVLHERLRRWQLVGLLLAGVGVGVQIYATRSVPWIALALAGSFTTYALLRKQMGVGPLIGGIVETMLLLPFGIVLVIAQARHDLPRASEMAHVYAWLPAAGLVTAIPLLWFARATRTLRLSTMGFLQYLGPTLQFLVAIVVYHEPLSHRKLASFALIWIALAIYSIDSWRGFRERLEPV